MQLKVTQWTQRHLLHRLYIWVSRHLTNTKHTHTHTHALHTINTLTHKHMKKHNAPNKSNYANIVQHTCICTRMHTNTHTQMHMYRPVSVRRVAQCSQARQFNEAAPSSYASAHVHTCTCTHTACGTNWHTLHIYAVTVPHTILQSQCTWTHMHGGTSTCMHSDTL